MNSLTEDLAKAMSDPRLMSDDQLIAEIERTYDNGKVPEEVLPLVRAELTLHYRHAKFWNQHFQKRYEEGKDPDPPKPSPVRDFGMTEAEARAILKGGL